MFLNGCPGRRIVNSMADAPLTLNLKDQTKRPYFLWDEAATIEDLRRILRSGPPRERVRYMAKILREARFEDVWEFLTVTDLLHHWVQLQPYLGRKREYWAFFFRAWRARGLIP